MEVSMLAEDTLCLIIFQKRQTLLHPPSQFPISLITQLLMMIIFGKESFDHLQTVYNITLFPLSRSIIAVIMTIIMIIMEHYTVVSNTSHAVIIIKSRGPLYACCLPCYSLFVQKKAIKIILHY